MSRYLGAWEMLAMNMKPRLSELPHLAPIVKELDALILEARELEGLIQENAKEGLVPAPDRPPGRDAEDAERRIHLQRRGRRRDVAVGARKAINLRTTRKSDRAQD